MNDELKSCCLSVHRSSFLLMVGFVFASSVYGIGLPNTGGVGLPSSDFLTAPFLMSCGTGCGVGMEMGCGAVPPEEQGGGGGGGILLPAGFSSKACVCPCGLMPKPTMTPSSLMPRAS